MDSEYYERHILMPPKKDTNSLLDVNSNIYSEDVDEVDDGKWFEKHIMPAPDLKDQSIKALKQEPCEDIISRADAIKQIQRYGVGCFDPDEFSPEMCERYVISLLSNLPPYHNRGAKMAEPHESEE